MQKWVHKLDKIAKRLTNATVMALKKHIILLSINKTPCFCRRFLRITTMWTPEIK